ncbi:hypothetical protein GCM10009536_53910 [Streptomyces thermocarboxydus]
MASLVLIFFRSRSPGRGGASGVRGDRAAVMTFIVGDGPTGEGTEKAAASKPRPVPRGSPGAS